MTVLVLWPLFCAVRFLRNIDTGHWVQQAWKRNCCRMGQKEWDCVWPNALRDSYIANTSSSFSFPSPSLPLLYSPPPFLSFSSSLPYSSPSPSSPPFHEFSIHPETSHQSSLCGVKTQNMAIFWTSVTLRAWKFRNCFVFMQGNVARLHQCIRVGRHHRRVRSWLCAGRVKGGNPGPS